MRVFRGAIPLLAAFAALLSTESRAATYDLAGDALDSQRWSASTLGIFGFPLQGSLDIDFSDAMNVSADGTYVVQSFINLGPPLGAPGTLTVDIAGTLHATHGVLSGLDLLWTASTDSHVDETGTISATGSLCALLAPACTGDGVPFTLASLRQATGGNPTPPPQAFGLWSFSSGFSRLLETPQIVLTTYNVGNPAGRPPGSTQEYLVLRGTAVPEPGVLALLLASVAGLWGRFLGVADERAETCARAISRYSSRGSG